MKRDRLLFGLLNMGHFLCHLFMLIFAGVAALTLSTDWGLSYSELLAYATPGFAAFGLFALPAGWLADKWSRAGMMSVFFIGGGLASIATSFAQTPLQMGAGLGVIGMFAAIYHPVGLAIVTSRWKNIGMRLAMNGVWGNFGVAGAALITGYLIDHHGWRTAFILPGLLSIVCGFLYTGFCLREPEGHEKKTFQTRPGDASLTRRTSIIVFVTTAFSSIIFQSTSFALPKIFDERLQGISTQLLEALQALGLAANTNMATMVGVFTFTVFALASSAQLVVGVLLDRLGPRLVFIGAASLQLVFFSLMPGRQEGWALVVTLGFMLGAFGQIPITDFLIGKMATGAYRARVYGIRYVLSFTMLAATLPLISFVYEAGGFDMLFRILSCAALVILVAVWKLPRSLLSLDKPSQPSRELTKETEVLI